MNLQSLLVCSDDRTLRLLRNVLGELEIEVEHCEHPAEATKRLMEQRYEAVIIDCKDHNDFALLRGLRSNQQNRRSMAVAIIDAHSDLHGAFDMGANFVVYKPISSEKAKSSFRAARALMQRERRRSARLKVNFQAYFRFESGDGQQVTVSGLSEGGISVRFSGQLRKKAGVIEYSFALPDTTDVIQGTGLVAWQDSRRRAGIQFAAISEHCRHRLKEWMERQSGERNDPPSRGTLSALSLGGCFLRTQSAFPVQTRVELLLRAADCSVKIDGKVKFMDPELGMGIEFLDRNAEQQRQLEELIKRITLQPETVAEALVEPEGLDWKSAVEATSGEAEAKDEIQQDQLVELFDAGAALSREEFVRTLEQHEVAPEKTLVRTSSPQRREPRIAVSRPVQIWLQDGRRKPERHNTSMIDVSYHGARIDRTDLHLEPGDPVHLVTGDRDLRFRVIWVGKAGTPQEGQVGLQKVDD